MQAPAAVGGVYNIGGGSRISISHALSLIQQFAGRHFEIMHLPPQHSCTCRPSKVTCATRAPIPPAHKRTSAIGPGPISGRLRAQFDWVLANEEAPARLRR
jgi:hypothetical protein